MVNVDSILENYAEDWNVNDVSVTQRGETKFEARILRQGNSDRIVHMGESADAAVQGAKEYLARKLEAAIS